VNYSDENKVSFSDIGGRVLPDALTGNPTGFNVSLFPNESYWFNESSRILFDSHYYNVAWLGKENKIYKSTNVVKRGRFRIHLEPQPQTMSYG
jgi:hypothetical protein